ncbi:TetR/AcrR family transcriptional regulator [Marinobacter sp. 1-3A]|nr:TetR/AcrR family transcriptional regulator [Marinobacter sp. 1-3A]MBK1874995.1 TetR/AcrR family transcriptional regulator [Marinobacter sp. 1-3A]
MYRQPVQSRAQRSVRKILDAALEVLSEEGYAGLTTNKVATRAGINVATLYTYFPNKAAIIIQVAKEFEEARLNYLIDNTERFEHTGNWQIWLQDAIDSLVQFRCDNPDSLYLRAAIMSAPELRYLDEETNARAIDALLPGLQAHSDALPTTLLSAIARTVTLTTTTVIDDAFALSPYNESLIQELKLLLLNYLKCYLK